MSYPVEFLDELADKATVRFDEPLSLYTTFNTGGTADIFVAPDNSESVSAILKMSEEQGVPVTVIGGGSNLLVSDKGVRGIVLRIYDDKTPDENGIKEKIFISNNGLIYTEASVKKNQFIEFALSNGYSGIEFMAGIPGCIGGGIMMNAGTYMGTFMDVIHKVDVIRFNGTRESLSSKNCISSYRTFDAGGNAVITGAFFRLPLSEDPEKTRKEIVEILDDRSSKHPLDYPSAGSVFKNPEGHSSWKLVNDVGLKGKRIGGAMVSDKHTNFIINYDKASSGDIKNLIELIQREVNSKFGVSLETEIRMVGEF